MPEPIQRVRTETRTVRPFATAAGIVTDVGLRLYPGDAFDPSGSMRVREVDNGELAPELEFAIDVTPALSLGFAELVDLELVLVATDRRLSRTVVVDRWPLRDVPDGYVIGEADRDRFSWITGVDLSLAVVLNRELEQVAGRPWRTGTWLDRKDFRIGPPPQRRRIDIERWEPERFAAVGVPTATAYWVQFDTDALWDEEGDGTADITIAFRSNVYDALMRGSNTPSGKAVQAAILAEVVTDFIALGARIGGYDELPSGSPYHSLVTRIARESGVSVDDLLDASQERARVRALVQAALNTQLELEHL